MENQIVDAVTLGGSAVELDFSMISLFLRADLVVKSVIVVLLLASLWCWAIIFDKWFGIRRLNKRSSEFEQAFWSGASLDDLYDRIAAQPHDSMSAIFVAAMREWRRAHPTYMADASREHRERRRQRAAAAAAGGTTPLTVFAPP